MIWAKLVNVSGLCRLRGWALALVAGAASLPASPVYADELAGEPREGDAGFHAVEELGYEAIVDASEGYGAKLRIRVALHNTGRSVRDAVASLGLPHGTEILGLSINRDGTWVSGRETVQHDAPERRDPGTVFVRTLPALAAGDVPVAEVVVFGIDADQTIHFELECAVVPRLRGERWELDLPARGAHQPILASQRRVLVRGLPKGSSFWVDEEANAGAPAIVTSASDAVTVSWPAALEERETLEGRLEVVSGPPGFDDGRVRVYVRLGRTDAPRPDHLVLAVDRSRSTSPRMQRETLRVAEAMLDALPEGTTFDAIGFAREAVSLLPRGSARTSDPSAREALATALDANVRESGTDIENALVEAVTRAKRPGSKRPMIAVVTDGMLPYSADAAQIRRAIVDAWGSDRGLPEIVFIIDDQMLERSGLSATHPVARLAGALGARLTLETLETLRAEDRRALLEAPQVLGDLALDLPANVTLDRELPGGLVAGSFLLVQGRYVGTPPTQVTITGQLAGKRLSRKLKAHAMPRVPEALANAVDGDPAEPATEGFVTPPWYRNEARKTARRSIALAGRRGTETRGTLDRRIFRNYLSTRVVPRARACYNQSLRRNPRQAGHVELLFEVGKGEVMLAQTGKSTLVHDDRKLVECLEKAAWALDIPAGKLDDKVYLLRYPLNLVAPKDERSMGHVEGISEEMMELLLAFPNSTELGAKPKPAAAPVSAGSRRVAPSE